ncbi:Anaphase promoting complex (APC) subunit 2 [Haloarcula vallismortis]|uniref:Anaphase-promoting complex subunit 2 C-terminal domain-containing protein n=2 Tax=Haloarcula vallismortis TaxID=28442 RepID=M0JCK8_HALVA|nr:hypothetical protein [Haloarcula vallismortis]EMA06862.1 hypothetical protein C437_12178 [Haloarcula vallismortis ATCC 29715]SDW67516.1 Anaphase promoting complex (APC) subunit 2 [Haloarcula vallismortis]
MIDGEQDLQELVVSIVESEDAVAVTAGLISQRMENRHGVEKDRRELREFLDGLVEEDVLEYNHGEYGEYTIPE